MQLIVGLGNPGPKYRGTRHNVGFEVIEEVARRWSLAFESAPGHAVMARTRGEAGHVLVAKPLTFMNRSGEAVAGLCRYYHVALDGLLVVAEDVNLPLGRLRARSRGSAGGHNGFQSVIEALATQEFARLRVGVGRGDPRRDLGAHVLSRFTPDERDAIAAAVAQAADAVELFVSVGITGVMNQYNARDRGEGDDSSDSEDQEREADRQEPG